MIKAYDNETDWLSDSNNCYKIETLPCETFEPLPTTTRFLTIDDLTPVPNLTRDDAGYYLSMSAKIIRHNQDEQEWSDETITVKLLQSYPKFYSYKIKGFIEIFKQVLKLRPIWLEGFNQPTTKEPLPTNPLLETLNQIKTLMEQLEKQLQNQGENNNNG